MKIFILIMLILGQAYATENLERKRGFEIGLGVNFNNYRMPIQFEGVTKNKIDSTTFLFGPALNIGYDVVPSEHFLFGIRLEGMTDSNYKMGNKKSSTITDTVTARINAFNATFRFGYIFDFLAVDVLGDTSQDVGEFFIEAGLGSGQRNFSKHYTYNDGTIAEAYNVHAKEKYLSRILAVGVNLTTSSGAYVEAKLMQTSVMSNKIDFNGSSLISGGTLTPSSKTLKDTNKSSVIGGAIIIGHHY
jgi:hypothetical protein